MDNQIVVFVLGLRHFGVNIASVETIIKMQSIKKMPYAAPHFIEGVINLHGKVLPVIDLCMRFGMVPQDAEKNSRIIISRVNLAEFGMSDKLGVVRYATQQYQFLESSEISPNASPETFKLIDEEVQRITTEQYERAQQLLKEHRSALETVS